MNYSTAIFFLDPNVRAIRVTYEENESKTTLFKTLDDSIKKDDYVTVPTGTRHGMTVCKVKEADIEVDPDYSGQVDWIVGKVDKDRYDSILKQEDVAIQKLKSAEIRKKRSAIQETLKKELSLDLNALAIDHIPTTEAEKAA
jgi:hypothetical protein